MDEACMGLGVFVGIDRVLQLASQRVDVCVSLSRAFYPIGPEETRIEPLWAVRGRTLTSYKIAHLIEIRPGVCLACEVTMLPSPIGPCPS